MCPEKCVTPHRGSVAGRTDFLAAARSQLARKVEGGSSPIRPGPHRVQWTDLSYFCGEVRNRINLIGRTPSVSYLPLQSCRGIGNKLHYATECPLTESWHLKTPASHLIHAFLRQTAGNQ
ncbi:hypothetical protein AVEN_107028-1 [Araneus ventricosus]|uniref:Uncharacterized protein n=1 Tax=Araneus ventricosus TaxID=182803 RepID=A0A4Y2NNQ5_ARAVE|nr:hypothetical protein AVEN_92126-1 [Araneus ventricosus]GBN55606.1 hypothetical protein AVEN_123252-1 [Araneus ventricosus]GBN64004.1 hypothetical protein AVEN_223865-1 [Araneus ventricosus]GBN67311.1 hypothetical protein AVEN_107028-1 [Araneus ventricosus]